MGIIVEDLFQRADVAASSWGTATDGHSWTTVRLDAGTAQVSSHVGQVSNSNGNGTNILLGSASRTDAEVLVQFSLSNFNASCHPILRYQSDGNFYYAGQDSGSLAIKTRVNNVGAQLVAAANPVTPTTKYWLRFNITGTTLSLRFWQDGTAEPGTWNLTTTDTTYAAGAIGQRCTCFGLTDTVSVYSFQVSDLTTTPANQLVADTFTRANQSGFGSASDSEVWVAKDSVATYSIVSNRGQATGFTASSNSVIGGTAEYDTDMKVRFSTSVPASDGCFFIARWTSVQNFYFVGFVQNTLSIRKIVASTTTTITSTAFTATASTNYWLRCLIQGISIKIKVWADGTSEPAAYALTTTDSALTQGNPGLRLFGGASDIVLVDSFTVNVPGGGHVLISEGYGGVFS